MKFLARTFILIYFLRFTLEHKIVNNLLEEVLKAHLEEGKMALNETNKIFVELEFSLKDKIEKILDYEEKNLYGYKVCAISQIIPIELYTAISNMQDELINNFKKYIKIHCITSYCQCFYLQLMGIAGIQPGKELGIIFSKSLSALYRYYNIISIMNEIKTIDNEIKKKTGMSDINHIHIKLNRKLKTFLKEKGTTYEDETRFIYMKEEINNYPYFSDDNLKQRMSDKVSELNNKANKIYDYENKRFIVFINNVIKLVNSIEGEGLYEIELSLKGSKIENIIKRVSCLELVVIIIRFLNKIKYDENFSSLDKSFYEGMFDILMKSKLVNLIYQVILLISNCTDINNDIDCKIEKQIVYYACQNLLEILNTIIKDFNFSKFEDFIIVLNNLLDLNANIDGKSTGYDFRYGAHIDEKLTSVDVLENFDQSIKSSDDNIEKAKKSLINKKNSDDNQIKNGRFDLINKMDAVKKYIIKNICKMTQAFITRKDNTSDMAASNINGPGNTIKQKEKLKEQNSCYIKMFLLFVATSSLVFLLGFIPYRLMIWIRSK